MAAIVFVILLGYASYDIGRRTTFPGSKPQLKTRIEENFLKADSAKRAGTADTLMADSLR